MSTDDARAELVDQVGEVVARLTAAAALEVHHRGRRSGLSLGSVDAVVVGLLQVHGPLTPRELARAAAISSSGTITGAIDRLERAGWTTRTPCQADRRKVFITLTDAVRDRSPAPEALHDCTDDELAAAARVLEELARRALPPTGQENDGAGHG